MLARRAQYIKQQHFRSCLFREALQTEGAAAVFLQPWRIPAPLQCMCPLASFSSLFWYHGRQIYHCGSLSVALVNLVCVFAAQDQTGEIEEVSGRPLDTEARSPAVKLDSPMCLNCRYDMHLRGKFVV